MGPARRRDPTDLHAWCCCATTTSTPRRPAGFELVAEICDEVVADVLTIEAEGDTRLAQLFDLVMLGDYVSLELAILRASTRGRCRSSTRSRNASAESDGR